MDHRFPLSVMGEMRGFMGIPVMGMGMARLERWWRKERRGRVNRYLPTVHTHLGKKSTDV